MTVWLSLSLRPGEDLGRERGGGLRGSGLEPEGQEPGAATCEPGEDGCLANLSFLCVFSVWPLGRLQDAHPPR